MKLYYFTMLKMNYKTDTMQKAYLFEEQSVDWNNSIERDHCFNFEDDIFYNESPLMLPQSEFDDLVSLMDGKSSSKYFRGMDANYWRKLLSEATIQTVSLL